MSYAEAAKSGGPAKVKKTPEPAKLENAAEPLGHVETLDGDKFDQKRKQTAKDVEHVTSEAAKASKKQAEVIKKELDELEPKSAPYIQRAIDFAKKKYAAVFQAVATGFNSDAVSQASVELQNPVVLSQLALILGGAAAGWYVYAERARIRSENKCAVAIHAGIVTALVLGDVYVFQKLYPRHKRN